MFRAILVTQWKWTRTTALLATVAAFSIPVASLQSARDADTPLEFISRMQAWGIGYALLAAGVGLLVALAAWGHDHQGRHVYALSLPVSRQRYALLRYGAGATYLVPAIIAVLIGSLVVIATGAIPQGLHAFPIALTLRFGLAALVAYSVFFAIGAGTTRTAAAVLALIAVVLFAQFVISASGVQFDLLRYVADGLFGTGGVLSVFSGRWMLVDV
ncbi:MAG TPA: hypothetical protein VKH19_17990 [Gemmatimonadaceae bacterium]|nr:hypothetical protein [Gemmatimonadaceae bacterium]